MKGIIFSSESVRAILDDRKTQIRRVIKPQPERCKGTWNGGHECYRWRKREYWDNDGPCFPSRQIAEFAPHKKGEELYVKETWGERDDPNGNTHFVYLSEYDASECEWAPTNRWRSPMSMQKDAARLFLRITDVRVERLQGISEKDAQAEGAYSLGNPLMPQMGASYRLGFSLLWDEINGKKKGFAWDDNPFVFVYEFEVVEKPESEGENE